MTKSFAVPVFIIRLQTNAVSLSVAGNPSSEINPYRSSCGRRSGPLGRRFTVTRGTQPVTARHAARHGALIELETAAHSGGTVTRRHRIPAAGASGSLSARQSMAGCVRRDAAGGGGGGGGGVSGGGGGTGPTERAHGQRPPPRPVSQLRHRSRPPAETAPAAPLRPRPRPPRRHSA